MRTRGPVAWFVANASPLDLDVDIDPDILPVVLNLVGLVADRCTLRRETTH